MNRYTKIDYSACRVKGLGTISFRSSYLDNIYFNIRMAEHAITRYGYNTPAGENMEFTAKQIRELPYKHPVRDLFAQYRLMQRDDIRDFINRRGMTTQEFWQHANK